MSSVEYENKILNAIETIVDSSISKAGYDKTIKAIIDKCIDSTSGCYQVKYQDSIFEAYATDKDVIYAKGALVQILVPGNDMTQNKTILGLVQRNKSELISTANSEIQYKITGPNVISSETVFGLCSYLESDKEILYNKDAGINLINLDTVTFQNNIKKTNTILCGAEFKTALASEQTIIGNFGIAFDIDFKDNITGDIVTKTYIVDINQMLGNPYNQKDFTRQTGIFEINGESFDSINQIYIFSEDFPNIATGKDDDIFAQNFELTCASKLTSEELIGYSMSLITLGKNYFNSLDTDDDTITLLANFKIKGASVSASTPGVEYYWFRENASITMRSLNYCNYGGEGWECLNRYNVVNSGADTKTWISGPSGYNIKKSDISAGMATYKCVVVYNNVNTYEDSITIYNYDTLYELNIISDQGTIFYYDNGNPTLTLTVNGSGVPDPELTYQWSVVDNNGQYIRLLDTDIENTEYNNAKSAYDTLMANIASGAAMPVANKTALESYKAILDKYEDIHRVEDNVIYKAQIKDITDYVIYKCTVYRGSVYIGTAAITLINNLNIEGLYHLEIVNGEQVFNYNAMGVSPTNKALENPITIKPLSFKIYDNLGNELGDTVYRHCDIQWTIPKENTMLIGNDATNVLTYPFEIANIYDNFKINNNIELTVKYKELNLKGQTTLSFLKDGDPGINGTDIICKIVPNINGNLDTYPMLINGTPNFTPVTANKWFKVQLWKNGSLIFNNVSNGNSTEGIAATVKWSILKNKYTSSISDSSAITVDNNGNFSYNTFGDTYANIVKCSVEYDGKYYYSMLPLITQNISDNTYTIELEKNTGYRYVMYSSGGKEPQYDNTYPFTLKVKKIINGYVEDVSNTPNSTYKLTYNWASKGRIYKSTGWVNTGNLTAISGETTNINKRSFKPSDTFDGECVTNAVYITIANNGTQIAQVHIPIHFYLNKYGIAALNNWDGNSIDINNELGSILAPQVGAGSKNSSNQFTGVLMGKVKESNLTEKEGLFGYYNGDQTIFLDANTGKAEFGKQGASQIILDPTDNTAKIQSGNYVAGTSGLLIDFTTPEIKFGSGNFSINSSGHLTAKGGGSIAGWTINNDYLQGKATDGRYIQIRSNGNIRAYDGTNTYWSISRDGSASFTNVAITATNKTSGNVLNINNKFKVTYEGNTTITADADITGKITATSGKIGNWNINSGAIKYNDNIYLGSNGNVKFGSKFSVNTSGEITATGGTIGGCTIDSAGIYSGSESATAGVGLYGSRQAFWAGSTVTNNGSAPFRVDHAGNLTASSATIEGTITATSGTFSNCTVTDTCSVPASTITGVLATKHIPSLSADKISGGTISSSSLNISKNGYYLKMGYGTKHPSVSSLNVDSGKDASVVINGGAITHNSSTFHLQGNVEANGAFKVNAGGTVYTGVGNGNQVNFCVGITVKSDGTVSQTKWRGYTFVKGICTSIGDVQTFNY